MTTVGTKLAGGSAWRRRSARAVAGYVAAGLLAMWVGLAGVPARAGDPAVIFMAQVGKDLMAAARTRSPGAMASVVERHADVTQIGLFSLGEYRNRLPQEERPSYFSGMARFIGRYAANEVAQIPARSRRVGEPKCPQRVRRHGGQQDRAG